MRIGLTTALMALGALALDACHKQEQPQRNVVAMGDDLMNGSMPANADIETLPPDESSETPSNQLASGTDNADVNYVTNNSD